MNRHDVPNPRGTESESPFAAVVEAEALRAALDAVAALVEECVVRVTPTGVAVDAQDPATVAMVSLELPASAFEAYDATETTLGVDLERLCDVVGMADRDELVRLTVDDGSRTLHVRIGDLSYTLGLLDPDTVRSPPEVVDFSETFDAAATVEGASVADAVAAADMVSDHLALGVDPDRDLLYASAEGDTDTVQVEFHADDCADFEPGDANSLFSVSYLDAVAGVLPTDADVTLRLGQEAPTELSFALGDAAVTYVVAPRIRQS